jgi:hypothetical protein
MEGQAPGRMLYTMIPTAQKPIAALAKPGQPSARPRLDNTAIEAMSLAQLDAILCSPEHYAATVTRNYGERDPLERADELLFRCNCGAQPRVVYEMPTPAQLSQMSRPLPPGAREAYFVVCAGCGHRGLPSLREWRTVVDWNYRQSPRFAPALADFPFFNLAGLSAEDALVRLESIQLDLTLRRAQARKQKQAGRDVGGRYLAKIDAFLGWAHVALKIARPPKAGGGAPRRAA